jgi:hypothetical protein
MSVFLIVLIQKNCVRNLLLKLVSNFYQGLGYERLNRLTKFSKLVTKDSGGVVFSSK